ncbi:hypothetical protein IWX90DRAFT_13401 [Phyllosticta citrichinensis]|uniref:Uncharacterized protein n=1 Tax=Phyllosticta citrichinensis TaxID=1130410 RepID=A0ABR1Y6B3_9PEZI
MPGARENFGHCTFEEAPSRVPDDDPCTTLAVPPANPLRAGPARRKSLVLLGWPKAERNEVCVGPTLLLPIGEPTTALGNGRDRKSALLVLSSFSGWSACSLGREEARKEMGEGMRRGPAWIWLFGQRVVAGAFVHAFSWGVQRSLLAPHPRARPLMHVCSHAPLAGCLVRCRSALDKNRLRSLGVWSFAKRARAATPCVRLTGWSVASTGGVDEQKRAERRERPNSEEITKVEEKRATVAPAAVQQGILHSPFRLPRLVSSATRLHLPSLRGETHSEHQPLWLAHTFSRRLPSPSFQSRKMPQTQAQPRNCRRRRPVEGGCVASAGKFTAIATFDVVENCRNAVVWVGQATASQSSDGELPGTVTSAVSQRPSSRVLWLAGCLSVVVVRW